MTYSTIFKADVPAAAGNADSYALAMPSNAPSAASPYAGVVTRVSVTPMAAIDTANTESRTYNVYNRGNTNGAGTTLVATLALVAAVADKVDNTPFDLTLSATAANLVVAVGDVLEVESLHVGSTGLAAPRSMVNITVQRTLS